MNIRQDLLDALPELREWRRDIHQHPELAFEETRTAAFVASKLRSFGLAPETGIGGTGVVVVIKGQSPGPSLGLRADMDALPMTEESGKEYSSTVPGRSHACGHDGHTVTLLGVARLLASNPPARGQVLLIFQPAEELAAGAQAMIASGLLDRYKIDEIYAFHNIPSFDPGVAAVISGPTLNGAHAWEVEVEGVGGHGAAFYRTVDPLQAAARIAIEISSIAGRYIDPADAALITVGAIHAGQADNVIPSRAVLKGSSRALSTTVLDCIAERLRKICDGMAVATGCSIKLKTLSPCPPCVNNIEQVRVAAAACGHVVGSNNVITDARPLPFTDDFAHFLNVIPGAYFWLGQRSVMCHHPGYDFDDQLLAVAGSIFLEIIDKRLEAPEPER
jgi:hippurate hydrolase